MDGLIKGPSQAPIAQQTALGWILSGNVRTFNCHIVTNNISDLSKYWEIEDVEPSSSSSLTSEEQYCEEFYQQTTRRLDTGRYEVGIPMKPEYENQLGSSKSKAIAQFKQLERKMCNNLLFSESYKSFMSEYQQLGHMCKADNVDESKPAFYLPHHGVIKLDSTTTKLRVVFNASSKSSSGKSLNDLMCCGPNLQKDLMTLILNWRTYNVNITPIFYMDDLLGGTNTINQARELQHQLIEMLKGAGMNLRKWSSNDPELLKDLSSDQLNSPFDFKCSESKKTLGLRWNPSTDTFSFQNPVQCRNQCVTKRQLLSEISKLFDPLGWLSPLSIRAKLLFQNAWSLKLSWDENVPQSIQDDWIHLRSDLNLIDQFIIPRYIGNTNQLYQIHAFCDASDKAYACAVYVVSKDHKGECISRLAVAKTKLAPLAKKVSLPRLELCGALLLAQLIKKVMESLSNENVEIYAWTDSMIVLGWIQGDVHRWKQFVANRIITITNIVPSSCWHHVRSEDNAADCATRGLTSQKLLNHPLWWQGPKWIIHFDRNTLPVTSYQSPNIEIKKHCVNTALYKNNISVIQELLCNYSSLTRIVKIVAWISRFIKRSRGKHTGGTEFLTSAELHNALHLIIQNYQLYEFHEDIQFINQKGYVHPKSKISCLNPFLDEDILIKEENLPPGKWALGRIQDVHPGKDNYVRVVSLKTKGDNIIKRPVNKLVLLPTNEDTAQDQAIDQGNSSNPSPTHHVNKKRSIIVQLEQEISEIEHYDMLLKNTNEAPMRLRRGLVNGVGYIANSLFGVLDESIMESEFNILRRNENVMNKQFSFINQRLQDLAREVYEVRLVNQDNNYITSSSLAASIILSNLRWIQQTLIGTVTDISHGRIDSHLLSPEQLSYQLSIISSQLNGKLTIPVDIKNIKDLYRLLKVSARVISNYLIIEIKIPLLSNEMFELNKIISISQKQGQHYYQFLTSVSFIAYNLHKDTAFLLSEEDLKSCTHIPSDILLCSLNMPIYDLKMKQSICDIKIINHAHLCKSVKSSCEERWIKLHRPNTWLYTCCPECQVRIICANGVTMTHLINNGIITLGQGCTLKGDTFSIYAHNNFFSNLNIHHHIEVPEVSMLNRIMKTSIPDNISMVEDHQVIWDQLRAQIDEVKEQSSTDLSIHDVHHYTVLYISVAAVIILGGVVVYLIRSRRAAARAAASPAPPGPGGCWGGAGDSRAGGSGASGVTSSAISA
ncbi:hypothetical protein HF086_010121 [Spodoptera exigua]|uniref:DUF5641 domain-containing protein n=1 Tax=Spodoptera exigua TaxID=7107 RepID=A0A922SQJ6_SPOEX|nr:hypothetical protein HF086_010121 [Spodoptera exigua]